MAGYILKACIGQNDRNKMEEVIQYHHRRDR